MTWHARALHQTFETYIAEATSHYASKHEEEALAITYTMYSEAEEEVPLAISIWRALRRPSQEELEESDAASSASSASNLDSKNMASRSLLFCELWRLGARTSIHDTCGGWEQNTPCGPKVLGSWYIDTRLQLLDHRTYLESYNITKTKILLKEIFKTIIQSIKNSITTDF